MKHRTTLVPLIAERLRTRTRAEWLAALEAAGVPCGPINDIGEVFEDPQAPRLGERTDEALRTELGMTDAEIERVRAAGALG